MNLMPIQILLFVIQIVSYSIMFVFGTIGNSLVSIAALKQHRSMENKIGRTNVHMMVLHLTIAGILKLLKLS